MFSKFQKPNSGLYLSRIAKLVAKVESSWNLSKDVIDIDQRMLRNLEVIIEKLVVDARDLIINKVHVWHGRLLWIKPENMYFQTGMEQQLSTNTPRL